MYMDEEERFKCIKGSRQFTCVNTLNLDLCQQPKHLIPNCPMRFVFHFNSDKVMFKNDTNSSTVVPKFKLLGMKLFIRRFQLNKGCSAGIESGLQVRPAKYFITRSEVEVNHIPTGVTRYTQDMVLKNRLPRLFLIAFQPNKVLTGDYATDALEFAHNGVKSVTAYVDGRMINGVPYQPDYENDNYQFEHYMMYSSLGQTHERPLMHIPYKKMKKSHAFYIFNNSADYTNAGPENGSFDLTKTGSVKVEVEFNKATTEPMNYIIYSHYNDWIDINIHREVVTHS